MDIDIGFPIVVLTLAIGFGALVNADINEDIRKRECRVELATQTKLDTVNIIALCNGVKK
jgi:hypothetical protein